MNDIQKNMIYLLTCSVNGITPDKEQVKTMDIEKLYRYAKFHTLRAAVCIALERAGVNDEHFHQAYKKAIRKNIMFDMERMAIFDAFEQHGIWYMPLKGSILKELYPENGMREMSDNDILYDGSKHGEVKKIMLEKGYTVESFGEKIHDVYMKPPVLNYEMHSALFSSKNNKPLSRYYAEIKDMLLKDEGNAFGYHFSDEDFYVYVTAHEWKHYTVKGTGIRSLLDCYIYIRAKGDNLDLKYIRKQCKNLGIEDFEKERRELAMKIFSSEVLPELNADETEMLMNYLTAGTYGSFESVLERNLKGRSKLSFWLHSIFLPRKQMARHVQFTAKSPLLYPVGVVWRCFHVLIFGRNKIKKALKILKNSDK